MRYRAAAVVLALAAAVAIGQVPMYSDYPWGLLNNGTDQGPVWNLDCKAPLWCDTPTYGNGRLRLGDGGVLPIEVERARYANDAGRSDFAAIADFARDAGLASRALAADYADDAGFALISNFSAYAADAGYAQTAGTAAVAAYALDAGLAARAGVADFARDAGSAANADFARDAGSAANADFARDAGSAARADFARDAGSAAVADFARDAGSAANADFARDAGSAAVADFARDAGSAAVADFARDAGSSATADFARDAGSAAVADFARDAGNAAVADFARDAGSAARADFARDAGSAAVADFARDAGSAASADVATYATSAGSAGTATTATYAADAGNVVCSGCVNAERIADGAVSRLKILAAAIDHTRIADGGIVGGNIIPGGVTSTEIGTDAVTDVKILAGAVTEAKIGTGAVTVNKIGTSAVTETKIDSGAVTEAKIGALAVTNGKLGNLAISSGKIQDLAVQTAKLDNLAVTEGKIGSLAVTNGKLGDLSVSTGKLQDDSITTPKVFENAITYPKLDNGTPFQAWDEGRGGLLADRITSVVNGSRNTPEATDEWTQFTPTSGATDFYFVTNIQYRAAKETFATVTYRCNGSNWKATDVIRLFEIGAYASATATMYGDGKWHTAVFDISAFTGTNSMRIDFQDSGTAIGSGSTLDVAHVGAGVVGASGGVGLINYRGGVGIGASVPTDKLTVASSGAVALRIQANTTAGTSNEAQINMHSGDDYTRLFYRDSDSNFGIYHGVAGTYATKLRLNSSGLALMEGGGNVGIGNSGPNYRLDVTGATLGGVAGNESAVHRLYAASANGDQIITRLRRASTGSNWDTADWQMFRRVDSTDMAGIQFNRSQGIDLVTGGTTAQLTVASGGNVGIGVTSPEEKLEVRTGSSAYGVLHSNGTIKLGSYISTEGQFGTKSNHDLAFFTNNGAARVRITAGGETRVVSLAGGGTRGVSADNNGALIPDPSDATLKTAVEGLRGSLQKVLNMRPVSFLWKDAERFGPQREVGFIAQEMMSEVPEAVSVNSGGLYSLDYSKLVAVVVGAIQELFDDRTWMAKRIQELEDRAQRAEDKLAQLEARLSSLENHSGIKGCGNCPQTDDGGVGGR